MSSSFENHPSLSRSKSLNAKRTRPKVPEMTKDARPTINSRKSIVRLPSQSRMSTSLSR